MSVSAGAKQEKMQHIYKDLWEMSSSWPAKQSLRERGEHPTSSATDLEDDNSHHDRLAERGLCVLKHLKKRMWGKAEKQGNGREITNTKDLSWVVGSG